MKSIKGIIIKREHYDKLIDNPGDSCFSILFDNLIMKMKGYFYSLIVDGDTFNQPDSAYENGLNEQAFIDLIRKGYENSINWDPDDFNISVICNSDHFSKLAKMMRDSWSVIFTFPIRFNQESLLLKHIHDIQNLNEIEKIIAAENMSIYHNFDGSCWEFYSRETIVMNYLFNDMVKRKIPFQISNKFPPLKELYTADSSYLRNLKWVK